MRRFTSLLVVLLVTLPSTGCDLVGDLFEFGFWVLVILGLLLVLLVWSVARMFGGDGTEPHRTAEIPPAEEPVPPAEPRRREEPGRPVEPERPEEPRPPEEPPSPGDRTPPREP